MGVVYKARQLRLDRLVALKTVRVGLAGDVGLERFLGEASTIARLTHPNIVRVHAVGDQDGVPFFEMEFVVGGNLASRIAGKPWPAREAAGVVEPLARGIEHAHRQGVVHRDLKPENVLLTEDATPKVADFGLAKLVGSDSGLTQTQAIMGTPSYMAPEQADGRTREVGPAADVYSLGAILYELLTGRPPFRASSTLETLEQVRRADPVSPSRLQQGMPRDIETICLKCLEKGPARRYASAELLADDLRRFLDRRPVVARPVGPVGRLARWCRRSPVLAGLAAAVLLLMITVTGISLTAAIRVAASAAQERRTLYFARMNLVQQAWEAANVRQMRELLAYYERDAGRDDLRGFEWYYWRRLTDLPAVELLGHRKPAVALAFSTDGRTLASADLGRDIILWDRARGVAERTYTLPIDGPILALAFSPDGSTLAAGLEDGSILVWGRDDREPRARLRDGAERVMAMTFVDDRTLISAHEPNLNRTRDLRSGTLARTVRGSVPPPGRVDDDHPRAQAITRDGRLIAAVGPDGLVIVRETDAVAPDPRPGAGPASDPPRPRTGSSPPAESSFSVGRLTARSLEFSPDGRYLAVGGEDLAITIWDVGRREVRHVFRGHTATPWSLSFSPDGRTLASGGLDNTVLLWDLAAGRLEMPLKGGGGPVLVVAYSPDGRSLASGSEDRSVNLWDLSRSSKNAPLGGHAAGVSGVAFSPDGRTLASGCRDGRVAFWEVESGRPDGSIEGRSPAQPDGHPSQIRSLVYSRDGRTLFTAGRNSPIRLWDPRARTFLGELTAGTDDDARTIFYLALSSDGSTLASCDSKGRIVLWDLAARAPRAVPRASGNPVVALAFSPDGRTLAWSAVEGPIELWDLDGSRTVGRLGTDRSEFQSLAYSPDGRTLASGASDGTLTLWDVASRQPRAVQGAHTNRLASLEFTPDGRTLASGGRDDTIRLWDSATGTLKTTLKGHVGNVLSVRFSPDGTTLASGSLDGTARFWRTIQEGEPGGRPRGR